VSRAAAAALGFDYLDTGAAYRALAWCALADGIDTDDSAELVASLPHFDLSIGTEPSDYFVRVNSASALHDVTVAIREPRVTAVVSAIARVPEVRAFLVAHFRDIISSTSKPGIVVEGRDITTVVAPDARVRILLTASEEARMGRRSAELPGASAEKTARELSSRDAQDSRVVDFLNAAEGVTTLDSTDLDFEQTVQAVVSLVRTGTQN
jgi:cytidylate kinase